MTTENDSADPPLGACPPWCEKRPGHDWEDQWAHGPMREHLRTVDQMGPYNAIRVREYEHFTEAGTRVRQRGIDLDLDQSADWDAVNAERIVAAISTAITLYNQVDQ